jgi:hypothetical protein
MIRPEDSFNLRLYSTARHTALRPIGERRVHPRNTRNHPDARVALIASSIVIYGFNSPLLIDAGSCISRSASGRISCSTGTTCNRPAPVVVRTGLCERSADEERSEAGGTVN